QVACELYTRYSGTSYSRSEKVHSRTIFWGTTISKAQWNYKPLFHLSTWNASMRKFSCSHVFPMKNQCTRGKLPWEGKITGNKNNKDIIEDAFQRVSLLIGRSTRRQKRKEKTIYG